MKKQAVKKPAATEAPAASEVILSLADAAKLSVADTVSQFAGHVASRRRSFVAQGKLIHHLDNVKLPRGQSIYSILKAGGIPEGSVQQGRMTADCIAEMVIPGHLPEARFDEVITYRIARQARRLFQGKAAVTMTPAEVAAILATGEATAIFEELDCLAEHGMTIAAREAHLAEKAAEAEREKAADNLKAEQEKAKAEEAAAAAAKATADALAAAEAATKKAEAEAASAKALLASRDALLPKASETTETAETETTTAEHEAETPEPETTAMPETETPEPASAEEEEEEEEAENDAHAPVVVDGTKGNKPAPTPPATPTLAEITGRFDDVLVAAMALGGEDMEKLVKFLRSRTEDMAATLQSFAQAA